MPKINSLLIKPAGPDCNLSCKYCFYACKQSLFPPETHRMTQEMLRTTLMQFLPMAGPLPSIGFQGGEPTLCGIDFFVEAVDTISRLKSKTQVVSLALQTNGLLLDQQWVDFFKKNHILVGLSIDGTAAMHDQHRIHADGTPSHAKVMRSMQMLQAAGVEYNTLSVLTSSNMYQAKELYHYLIEHGSGYMQFIPCVEVANDGIANYSLSPKAYGEFLIALLDLWLGDGMPKHYVRLFDEMLISMIEYASPSCHFSPACATNLVIEHNGDVYPCDFFVDPAWHLGNLSTLSLQEIANHPLLKRFVCQKAPTSECTSCPYLSLCQGDCPKYRLDACGNQTDRSYFCESYKMFFTYALPKMRLLKKTILQRDPALKNREATLQRNQLCPCHSGKKYKSCCQNTKGV